MLFHSIISTTNVSVSKEITMYHENTRKNSYVVGSGGLVKALPSFLLDRTGPSTCQIQA
jgi:hypothetical protein